MFTVERRRSFDVPPERVRAVLGDVEQLSRLLPRAERVDILARNENRARVAVTVRLGRFGSQRVEGEARMLEDGVRFVAVQPMQIDVRWMIIPRDGGCDVTVRLVTEVPTKMAAMARFVPQRMIEERIGAELEAVLAALATALAQDPA